MATMEDVARLAGVSLKTVSRVVNDSPHVAPETRKRVEGAVKELDFHPHSGARSLARRRSGTVGVVAPLQAEGIFSRSFILETLAGAGQALGDAGYELVLIARSASAPFIDLIKQRRVDGLLLMNVPIADPRVEELQAADVPFVLTCRPDVEGSPLDRAVRWVDADHAHGASAAVEYLASLGHSRFAVVSGPWDLMVSRLREKGARQTLARLGLPAPAATLNGEFSIEAGVELGEALLAEQGATTAVLCGDDHLAIGVIQAARARGLSVPGDLSVVGFDDIMFSAYVSPPLTTVRQPGREKGRLAAEMLLAIDSAGDNDPPAQVLLPTELVVRASTGPVLTRRSTGGWRSRQRVSR